MEIRGRKQVTFDLDTKALEIYYPAPSWKNAYNDIKKHMKSNGFKWQQGSVYVSIASVSPAQASRIIRMLVKKHPWLNLCMRDCVVTNIGREYSQRVSERSPTAKPLLT